MSIPSQYPIRQFNDRLTNLEACAHNAPEGTYEHAKEIAALVGDISERT